MVIYYVLRITILTQLRTYNVQFLPKLKDTIIVDVLLYTSAPTSTSMFLLLLSIIMAILHITNANEK